MKEEKMETRGMERKKMKAAKPQIAASSMQIQRRMTEPEGAASHMRNEAELCYEEDEATISTSAFTSLPSSTSVNESFKLVFFNQLINSQSSEGYWLEVSLDFVA
jgi:hypothetical protein